MSRRALKAINWSALAERIPETDKGILAAFKAKSDQFLRKVQENPESAPKIDWAYYKKSISVPGMVDAFQKQYESIQIPYPADNYTSIIEGLEKKETARLEEFVKESNADIEKCKKELERINNMIPISEMTLEEYKDAYPECALDPINRPTMWPHDPEMQPEVLEKKWKEEMKKGHH